ncbi:MAG TPA: peptidoglycan bridge formation glycyltransferase FemA/FemB family protein [Longimicrobiales bacterium]|nr:peptidoglycan bridge formation glycyltransferase FemA/FemB family protein [Longimicrobiales bacterium]
MTGLAWELFHREPGDWLDDVARLGAGPFQTVLGLRASGVAGEPIYLRCSDRQGRCVSLAAGLGPRRRIPFLKGEVLFPSVPVCGPGLDAGSVVPGLLETLRRSHARAVRFDSFDAQCAGLEGLGTPRPRREYRVAILAPDAQLAALADTHRRRVDQGDREGWSLERFAGDRAREAMRAVKAGTAQRASRKGRAFELAGEAWDPSDLVPPGETRLGGAVWAAMADGVLLSAVTVIWAGDRAFYVEGGSTPAGYAAVASHWMHTRIMNALGSTGIRLYNMGGAPAGAHEPASPHHGLHRFKMGFGAHEVRVQGAVITL